MHHVHAIQETPGIDRRGAHHPCQQVPRRQPCPWGQKHQEARAPLKGHQGHLSCPLDLEDPFHREGHGLLIACMERRYKIHQCEFLWKMPNIFSANNEQYPSNGLCSFLSNKTLCGCCIFLFSSQISQSVTQLRQNPAAPERGARESILSQGSQGIQGRMLQRFVTTSRITTVTKDEHMIGDEGGKAHSHRCPHVTSSIPFQIQEQSVHQSTIAGSRR